METRMPWLKCPSAKSDAKQSSYAANGRGCDDGRACAVSVVPGDQFLRPPLDCGAESRFASGGNRRAAVDRSNDLVEAVWHPQGNRAAQGLLDAVVAQGSLLGVTVQHDMDSAGAISQVRQVLDVADGIAHRR